MKFLKKLFGRKKEEVIPKMPFSQEQYDQDYELKTKGLEAVLGEMENLVGHAIIPFALGGAVDMYYFSKHIPGTGFATMELLDPSGNGPKPNRLGTYELVAFTRLPYSTTEDAQSLFNLIERRICGIFTAIGGYSYDAVLNPGETCEVPGQGEENSCLVFDLYKPNGAVFRIGEREHHLLLCLQVFRSEMEFARKNGTAALLDKLKEAGHYPYSDLDREAVA
jgi:hypothetical protein